MSRRRRALLVLALSLTLGAVAAGDVSRREAALRDGIGPGVRVLVAAEDLPAGAELTPRRLALRTVPERYAPAAAFVDPGEVAGLRTAAAVPRGADITSAVIASADERLPGDIGLRAGERAAQLVATAPPGAVVAGATVDVLAVGEGPSSTRLLLRGAEVLGAAPADPGPRGEGERVVVTLRVTAAQAVALAGAEAAAREVRLLARPREDGGRRGVP